MLRALCQARQIRGLLVLALIAGCQDSEFVKFNEAPTARITSPEANTSFAEGDQFTARGQVGDEDDPVENLVVTWHLGDEFGPQCIEVEPLDDGRTSCDFALDANGKEISLLVVDPSGEESWDFVHVLSIPAQGARGRDFISQ
jgi:hypothetical protein